MSSARYRLCLVLGCFTRLFTFFYVLLIMHLSVILVINQLDAQNLIL